MSLQLILGSAGSGKTTFLYDRIIQESIDHPDRDYIIIVPEQFTMQTQKDIVRMHPDHCTMNIDIVSFQRLAYRVFEELALTQPSILDDCGKSMVLRKVLTLCRKDLSLYAGHTGQAGFIERLKTTISEFTQYGISPDDLDGMAGKAKTPLLGQKIKEFSVIYRTFLEFIEGHYITNEEILDVLCRVIPRSENIRNSVIALDGFAGFMPVQYRLINLFMTLSRQVIVTVTADESVPSYGELPMQDLFAVSAQMITRLKSEAAKAGVPVLNDIRLAPGGHRDEELKFLERNLFRYSSKVYNGEDTGAVTFVEERNPGDEVSYLAGTVIHLVKDEGYRYRDIAVVTGDLEGYGKELQRQFTENGIPFFLDEKEPMLDHPLAELIRSALDIFSRDFSYESVFRYLRCGLAAGDAAMTDRLENYVLAMGLKGRKTWKEKWERVSAAYKSYDMDALNAYKDEVMAPLSILDETFLRTDKTVGGITDALTAFLDALGAGEKCVALEEELRERGEVRLASEYSQITGLVYGLLDELKNLLGDEKTNLREYSEILNAGLSQLSVGVIPATVDRVVTGDLMRTRLDHVKALFIVGVNDGIIPSKKEGGSLFTDPEREFFLENGRELAPAAREDSFRQRFFLYSLMGKPTDKLFISYARSGPDGKGRRESYLCTELRKMFPDTGILREPTQRNDWMISSGEGAKTYLIRSIREYLDTGIMSPLPVARFFASSKEGRRILDTFEDAAFRERVDTAIGKAVAGALYGRVIEGSVTRLEQYAACAYAHFLKYGLELKERPVFEVQAVDLGNLFHDSIERCFKKAQKMNLNWQTIPDDEREALVHQAVAEETEEYGDRILFSSSRNEYLASRVETITQKTVWALQQQIRKGDFYPAAFELSFSAGDRLKALEIPLEGGGRLSLGGRIDRMDLLDDGRSMYVKIIDYKSGSTTFDLSSLYNGLQIQLILYLDAAMELVQDKAPLRTVHPGGLFYYNISDPILDKDASVQNDDGSIDPDAVDEEVLKKLRMNGLCNSDPDVIDHMDHIYSGESCVIPVSLKDGELNVSRSSVADEEHLKMLRDFVRGQAAASGEKILDGRIAVDPYRQGQTTACDFCPYHSVCGFDPKLPGFDYRSLKKMKPEEIWEEICR